MNSQKKKRKKNFINRLKQAEVKLFSICADVYRNHEGNIFDKIYEILSLLKNEKLKMKNILIEMNKDMSKNPNFEQIRYSKTSTGIYKIAHDIIRLMKWICYYDRSNYENINY